MFMFKLIHVILWLAFVIGAGEVLVRFTQEMQGAAIQAHQRGPIMHKVFTEQLTDQK